MTVSRKKKITAEKKVNPGRKMTVARKTAKKERTAWLRMKAATKKKVTAKISQRMTTRKELTVKRQKTTMKTRETTKSGKTAASEKKSVAKRQKITTKKKATDESERRTTARKKQTRAMKNKRTAGFEQRTQRQNIVPKRQKTTIKNKKETAKSSHRSRTGTKTVESKQTMVPGMKKTADVKQGRTARKENVAKRQRAAAKTKDTAEFGHKFTARGKTVAGKQKTIAKKVHVGRRNVVATKTGKAAANDKTTARNRNSNVGRGKATASQTGKFASNAKKTTARNRKAHVGRNKVVATKNGKDAANAKKTTARNRKAHVGRGKVVATKTGKAAANAKKTTARIRKAHVGRGKVVATKTGKAAANAKKTTARNRKAHVGRNNVVATKTGKVAANDKTTARNRNSNVGRGKATASQTGKVAANAKKTTARIRKVQVGRRKVTITTGKAAANSKTTARNGKAHVVRGKVTATKTENRNDVGKLKPTVMTNDSAGNAQKTKQNADFSISDFDSGKEDGVLQEMIRLLDYQENIEKNQTAHNAEQGTASLNNFESDEDYTVETDTSKVSDFDTSGFSDSNHFDFDEEEPMVTDEPSRFPHSNQEKKQTTQTVEQGTASVDDFDSDEDYTVETDTSKVSDFDPSGFSDSYHFGLDEEEPMVTDEPSRFPHSNQETKQTTQTVEQGKASVNDFDWDELERKQTTQKAEKGPFNVYDLDSDEVEIVPTPFRQYKRVFKSYTKKTELTQKRADKPTSVFDSDSVGESVAEKNLSNSVTAEEALGKRIIPAPLSIGDDIKREEPRYKFFDSASEEEQHTQRRPNETHSESEPKLTGEPSNVLDADSDVEFIAEEEVEVIDVFDSDSEPEEMARNDALSIPGHDLSDAEIAQFRLLHAYDFSLSSKAMAERAARKQAAKERRMEDYIINRKRKRGQETTPPAKKRKCSENRYVLPVKTPEIRDLFLSLPWSHVIWQHVLPFLRVVDKFRLRAVNAHCKGVVERDFSMALSILPPSRPQMNRVAWRVLAGDNRFANRFTAPVFKRENIYKAFLFRDLIYMLHRKPAVRYLSLSYTSVSPNHYMLKMIAERFPELEELHLQGLQHVCLMDEGLSALTKYEMTRLHTLDLSRNSHDIRLSTLQKLVETQKSLRVLAIDATPLVDERVGSLLELADLWLYSDLERLTLTRIPLDGRYEPSCRSIPGPRYPCTLTMADAFFVKKTDPDGRIVKKFLYADCFSLGERRGDWERYIPEDELRYQGVEVRSQPCTFFNHLYQELLFEPSTILH